MVEEEGRRGERKGKDGSVRVGKEELMLLRLGGEDGVVGW